MKLDRYGTALAARGLQLHRIDALPRLRPTFMRADSGGTAPDEAERTQLPCLRP